MSSPEAASPGSGNGRDKPNDGRAAARLRSIVNDRLAPSKGLLARVEHRVRDWAERLPTAVTSPVQLVIRTWREFVEDECATHAAAIAFHTLFGLFPLLLGTGVILSLFAAGREAYAKALENVADLLPAGESVIEDNIREAIDLRGVFGIVALATLVWSGSRIFQALRLGLNAAWDVTDRRQAIRAKLIDIGAVLVIAPLILLSVASTALIESVRYVVTNLGESVPFLDFLEADTIWLFALRLVPLAMSVLLFELAYVMLPNRRVRWPHAVPGAVLAAILFEAGKLGFAWYVANISSFSLVYGSLSTVIVLMTWIYISAIILLLGAEFSSEFSRRWMGAEYPETAGVAGG